MLDLSQPLGEIEGLTLYRDHEQADLVYYLPDEVDLRMLGPGRPDIALQVFYPDQAIVGDDADLGQSVGSILSLGVGCTVGAGRLERVRDAVLERLGRDQVTLAVPPWEDGSVQLLLLDTQSGSSTAAAVVDDPLVLGVVGSRKPSLADGELSALFHARLERRGTALAAAALAGQIGSVAGVLYELSFAALRPSVELRLSADLNRCADFIRAGLGVQVYYVGADVSATFARMKEEGVIKVDLVSQASDPESERLVNEAVKDFYDVLMRELFRPTVSPAEALGAAGVPAAAGSTSIVKLSFAYTRVSHERIVEVDYRKRSATRRLHNPQAHLRQLASGAGGAAGVIQRVPLSLAWREFSVEVAAPEAFEDDRLRGLRVLLWRGQDGELPPEQARDGGLRMPAGATPLADLAFSREDRAPRRLGFVTQPGEAAFYRWQARLTYADSDEVDSPGEIWSEPHVSSSGDLDLFADVLAPRRQTVLQLGVGMQREPLFVEAELVARNARGEAIASHRLAVDARQPQARWAVRRGEADRFTLEATLRYRYADGASLQRPPQQLRDRELIAHDPFIRRLSAAPLVVNAPADLAEIVVVANYEHAPGGYRSELTRRLLPPDFRGDDLVMPVVGADDGMAWQAIALRTGAAPFEVGRGTTRGGVLTIAFGANRRLRFEWLGPTPAELGLRVLRAIVRARGAGGEVLDSATLEWRGDAVGGERLVTLPREGQAEWSIERRFEDGRRESTPFQPIDGDLVAVSGL